MRRRPATADDGAGVLHRRLFLRARKNQVEGTPFRRPRRAMYISLKHGEEGMAISASFGLAIRATVLLAAVSTAPGVQASDDSKYPDFGGVWRKPAGIGNQWDQTKPLGRAQQPPLTPEYQAIFEASLADQKAGGQGNDPPSRCVPFAMPRVMTVVFDMEIVVTPATTYMLFAHSMPRHVLTDGRDWPKQIEPTFLGLSIGKWIDADGDGRYDMLEIETRGLKGPRTYEGTGMPFHADNQTVVKERFFLDKGNVDALNDEITVFDHALTQPWTITKRYRRDHNPIRLEYNCSEDNHHVLIGGQDYFLSGDDMLMPSKKDQPPPDLRYFAPTRK
jgi:hypothetical protein